jgi:hypothetical protein
VELPEREIVSSVERVCAGELHNDAGTSRLRLARTSRLRAMHCSWLAGGGTQEAVSGKRATLRSVSELRGCECEILREKRLSGGREQQRDSRMVCHGSR